jgi:hypothetical protein
VANAMATIPAPANEFSEAFPRLRRIAYALLRLALVIAALAVFGSYLVLAVGHIADRYQLNFCSSVYAGLAAYVNTGQFYPELYDGTRYGGTRYMPLDFVLHAASARLTGEYLISGKVLTYTLTLVLCVQLWLSLRAVNCPRSIALASIGLLFLTECGYLATTTIRGDLLPVVCQLGAVLLVSSTITRMRIVVAALLCVLAILAKFSAVWALLAIAAYLVVHHRRYLPLYLGVAVASLGLALLACHWLSAGRMYQSFTALSVAGVASKDVVLAPLVMIWKLGRGGLAVAYLVPALIVEAIGAVVQRRTTIFHYSLVACCCVTLGIYTDRGADYNHLLDLVVLAVLMSGSLWGGLRSLAQREEPIRLALCLALLWVLFTGSLNTLVFPVVGVVRSIREQKVDPHFTSPPLAALIKDDESVLSEDAWVELSRGRLPTVLDAFAVARLPDSHPEMTDPLVKRVEAREFAYVVLLQRLDAVTPATDRYQWEDRAFGRRVVAAMRQNYRLHAEREGYVIYVPTSARQGPEKPKP